MANVSFEGENTYGGGISRGSVPYSQPVRGIPALLIRWHIAKDERQASIIQIGVIAACFLLSIYFFTSGGSANSGTGDDFGGAPGPGPDIINVNQ